MKNRVLKATAAGAAVAVAGLLAPTAAFAADDAGVPYSDQLWQKPPVLEGSYFPRGEFLVGQPFVPTQDGNLFGVDLWVFGIGEGRTPDDPVLESAKVYDITGLAYADFDLSTPIPGGVAVVGNSVPDPEHDGKFRLPLRFPEIPEVSAESRYLVVLEHRVDDGDYKASYAVGFEASSPSSQSVMNTEKGEWSGYMTGRIWHEVFLVDPLIPEIPEFVPSEVCDVPGVVQLPEQEGVEYSVNEDGYLLTVTAEVAEGLIVKPGADLGPWEFNVTPEKCEEEGGDVDGDVDADADGAGDSAGSGDVDGELDGDADAEQGDADAGQGESDADGDTAGVDEEMVDTGVNSTGLLAFGAIAVALGAAVLFLRRVMA